MSDRTAFETLGRTLATFSELYAQWMRGRTMNAHERLAIAHLWQNQSLAMSSLGERIPLSRAAVTALADRLEDAGYIVREVDPEDRRRTNLRLTELPSELLSDAAADFMGKVGEFEREQFTDEQMQVVRRWLAGVTDLAAADSEALRRRSDSDLDAESSLSGSVIA